MMNFTLSDDQKRMLLALARATIAAKLGTARDTVEYDDPLFLKHLGAFVTLHKSGNLRGCIGTITGVRPLKDTIIQMALSAAFSDPRFAPLRASEYPQIDIEISVLSPIEPATIDDIVVGVHGLIITKDYNRGLLLPQVATENGWTKEEFLSHTCIKAGLPPQTWRERGYTLEKFSAIVFGEKEN